MKYRFSNIRETIHSSRFTALPAGRQVHGSSGFTLLEIMIALAIIGTAIIVILHTVNYHADVEYNNSLSTKMLLLAREQLSEMKIDPVNKKGDLPESGFSYENIVTDLKNPGNDPEDAETSDIVVLKTIIIGHDMEVELSELVLK